MATTQVLSNAHLPPNVSIAYKVIVTIATTFPLVIFTLCLRMYSRIMILRKTGWDDLLIILATCCSLIQLVFNATWLYYGGGRHYQYTTPHASLKAAEFSTLTMFPFVFCTCLTKLSIAMMVLRLTNANWMRWMMYTLMLSLVLVNGACIIVMLSYCRPTHALWIVRLQQEGKAKCWGAQVLKISSDVQGAWSIVTDLVCTSTPLIMIWKLRMGVDQKVTLTILVGFGLATTACSCGRVYSYSHEVFGPDNTWTSTRSMVWIILEDNVGLIAANLPPLGKLRTMLREKMESHPTLRYLLIFSTGWSSMKASQNVTTIGGGNVRKKRGGVDMGSEVELVSTLGMHDS